MFASVQARGLPSISSEAACEISGRPKVLYSQVAQEETTLRLLGHRIGIQARLMNGEVTRANGPLVALTTLVESRWGAQFEQDDSPTREEHKAHPVSSNDGVDGTLQQPQTSHVTNPSTPAPILTAATSGADVGKPMEVDERPSVPIPNLTAMTSGAGAPMETDEHPAVPTHNLTVTTSGAEVGEPTEQDERPTVPASRIKATTSGADVGKPMEVDKHLATPTHNLTLVTTSGAEVGEPTEHDKHPTVPAPSLTAATSDTDVGEPMELDERCAVLAHNLTATTSGAEVRKPTELDERQEQQVAQSLSCEGLSFTL